jgi:hypothetical protein
MRLDPKSTWEVPEGEKETVRNKLMNVTPWLIAPVFDWKEVYDAFNKISDIIGKDWFLYNMDDLYGMVKIMCKGVNKRILDAINDYVMFLDERIKLNKESDVSMVSSRRTMYKKDIEELSNFERRWHSSTIMIHEPALIKAVYRNRLDNGQLIFTESAHNILNRAMKIAEIDLPWKDISQKICDLSDINNSNLGSNKLYIMDGYFTVMADGRTVDPLGPPDVLLLMFPDLNLYDFSRGFKRAISRIISDIASDHNGPWKSDFAWGGTHKWTEEQRREEYKKAYGSYGDPIYECAMWQGIYNDWRELSARNEHITDQQWWR